MLSPSASAATTSISPPSWSSTSSAWRKTSLSSTSTTRIGIRTMLFGRQEQVVVGLAAVLDVDLDIRVALGDPAEESVQGGGALAGQDRQDAPRLGEQLLDHRRRDLLEPRPARNGLALEQAEERTLL